MSEQSVLDRVKELGPQLSREERIEVLKFIADLPDSGITYQENKPRTRVPLSIENRKKALGLLELRTAWDCVIEDGEVIYSLEGREVFRCTFNRGNYAEICFEKLKDTALILTVEGAVRRLLRERLREEMMSHGTEPTEELLDAIEEKALQIHSEKLISQAVEEVATEIDENITIAVQMVFAKIVGASGFRVANELRDILNMGDAKISAAEIRTVVYAAEWEDLKSVVGITHGGSDPRVEVSDEQCLKIAADYPSLLSHWQQIVQTRETKPANWRAHAKLDEEDTHEDLLDRLDGQLPENDRGDYLNIPSALAHEHAARRAGIPNNEYSLSQLSRLRRRGQRVQSVKSSD